MTQSTQQITARPVQGQEDAWQDDFWRVRQFLVQTAPLTPVGLNWDVRRWDGQYFYNPRGVWAPEWAARACLFENEQGELVGVVNPEGVGDAYLQVHPDYRHIEETMIEWAEERLAAPVRDGQHQLAFYVLEYDAHRQRLLQARGYTKTSNYGMLRHMRLGAQPLPQPILAAGYKLRPTRSADMADCQRIADLLNAAFRRDFHNAAEYHMFARLAPCFRSELDLVVEAPDGSFAAYVGIPYDEINRRGIFEPVCTHPDHQRKGLAQALMLAGLHRLRAWGARTVTVDTGDMIPANRLYDSLGFTEAYLGFEWCKVF